MLIEDTINKQRKFYDYNEIKYTNQSFKNNFLNNHKSIFIIIIGLLINILLIINLNNSIKKSQNHIENIHQLIKENKYNSEIDYKKIYSNFRKESTLPRLKDIFQKMTFEQRLPLPEKIKCKPHLKGIELIAFLSLLTKNTIFFETGSGCSSVIAKYFAKKAYAIEGCKHFYEYGINNGLKDNLIFKDLKPDNPIWSYPGKNSNLNDYINYFTSYKKEYNADVILIDGRFKIATAMDIFNKIRNDTIILLHEYNFRPQYYIIEKYYKYIYHWGSLFAFIKNSEISQIPIDIQKQYWQFPL